MPQELLLDLRFFCGNRAELLIFRQAKCDFQGFFLSGGQMPEKVVEIIIIPLFTEIKVIDERFQLAIRLASRFVDFLSDRNQQRTNCGEIRYAFRWILCPPVSG